MTTATDLLLVEDNLMDIELTLHAFKMTKLKVNVHLARDGAMALDYLFGRQQYADRSLHPLPALILLDLKLPKIGGHEVLRQVKASPNLKTIPIIVLSASTEENDLTTSYRLGADIYLVKPINFNDFLEMIQQIGRDWLT